MSKVPVLCVDRTAIQANETGLHPVDIAAIPTECFHFINRSVCDSKKPYLFGVGHALPQLLVYVTVEYKGEYLTYSRAKGSEELLTKKRSIGFGGHVDITDVNPLNMDYRLLLKKSAVRELQEELSLTLSPNDINLSCAIVDLDDSVGLVHIGVHAHIALTDEQMEDTLANHEITDLRYMSIDELRYTLLDYENWSRMLIKAV